MRQAAWAYPLRMQIDQTFEYFGDIRRNKLLVKVSKGLECLAQ